VLVALETNAQTSPSQHTVSNSATNVPAERTIALSVPTGTPLQIALDREVRVKEVNQRHLRTIIALMRLAVLLGRYRAA
jgi:hypothetical protein